LHGLVATGVVAFPKSIVPRNETNANSTELDAVDRQKNAFSLTCATGYVDFYDCVFDSDT
jgi:hypothetical protein